MHNILTNETLFSTTGESVWREVRLQDLKELAVKLALYAPKQFVVRYGHLEDGNGKA